MKRPIRSIAAAFLAIAALLVAFLVVMPAWSGNDVALPGPGMELATGTDVGMPAAPESDAAPVADSEANREPDPPEDTIAVAIVDDEGRTLPGAVVSHLENAVVAESRSANDNGIVFLPASWTDVQAASPGHVCRRLDAEQWRQAARIQLPRAASATIRLSGPAGLPVAHRTVHLYTAFSEWPDKSWLGLDGGPAHGSAWVTSADGRTEQLGGLLPGMKYAAVPEIEGMGTVPPTEFMLEPGEAREVVVEMPSGVWIVGKAVDSSGKALARAMARAVRREFDGPHRIITQIGAIRTDKDGWFAIRPIRDDLEKPAVAPVPITVVIESRPGPGLCEMGIGAVQVQGPGVYDAGTLRVGVGSRLSGWARSEGKPLGAMPLRIAYGLWRVRIETDDQGYFCVTGLKHEMFDGAAHLTIRHEHADYEEQEQAEFPATVLDGPPLELEFKRQRLITGRFKLVGGEGNEDERPMLFYRAREASLGGVRPLSSDLGFAFSEPAMTLFITLGGYASELFDVTEADNDKEVVVQLRPGYTVLLQALPDQHGVKYLWIEDAKRRRLTIRTDSPPSTDAEITWIMPPGIELFLVAQLEGSDKVRRLPLGVSTIDGTRQVAPQELLAASAE